MSPSLPDPRAKIPHGPPILCVDSILSANSRRACAEYVVQDGPHVEDERMWELGMIEGLAQTAAALENPLGIPPGTRPGLGMLVGVRGFTFHRRPRIGERLEWCVEVLRRFGPFLLVTGEVHVEGELLAGGELRFYWEEEA